MLYGVEKKQPKIIFLMQKSSNNKTGVVLPEDSAIVTVDLINSIQPVCYSLKKTMKSNIMNDFQIIPCRNTFLGLKSTLM